MCKLNSKSMERISISEYNSFESDDLELKEMEKRRKELLVKKVHSNAITPPTENYQCYRTRVSGAKSGRLSSSTYEGLIDKLYEYYYGEDAEQQKISIPTFEEALKEMIDYRVSNKAISFNQGTHFRCDFQKHIANKPIAKKKITEITKGQLLAMYQEIAGDGSQILQSTLNNVRSAVNATFDYMQNKDGIEVIDAKRINIKDIIYKCSVNDNSEDVYSEEDANKLLDYLENLPEQTVESCMIRFAFCDYARISENRALMWKKDIDFEKGVIKLQHSMVDQPDGNVKRHATDVDYMKSHSRKGKRVIEISQDIRKILEDLMEINGDKEYVFNSKGKLPITINRFNKKLKDYCEECGVKYRSSHKIRFYGCSKMYDLGISEEKIQMKMGHTDVKMTRRYNRNKPKGLTEEETELCFGRRHK